MTSRRHQARERETAVLRLRIQGLSFADVAERLGIHDASGAHRIYRRALDATVREAASDLRALEGQRLDELLRHWWPQALRSNPQAAKVVLRIMDQRARLFGLNAPAQVQVTATPDLDAQIEQLVAELAEEIAMTAQALNEAPVIDGEVAPPLTGPVTRAESPPTGTHDGDR